MRNRPAKLVLFALAFAALAMLAPAPLWAQKGREPDEISRAGALKEGTGAIIISIRSELYLLDELSVWFVREGGSKDNPADLVRFTRSQPALAFGNRTTKYKVRAYQLPAGRWRLAGHGVRCEKVPAPDERCLVDVKVLGIGETVSFPSRGYGEDAPVFEVREGALTDAGDWGLTARNTIEWSPIPPDQARKALRRLSSLSAGPKVEVSEDYRLKYGLFPRSYDDDKNRRY
ncbi:hypothetical protein [Erythrobacter sp.]|uniref:hypothetical protein n=1 Tax=Erythrobacter sp. TaxID=1042 RepID=UPI001425BE97|nr:hypothetical protein [Erythrobacter sp.]QIQ86175.1 MAG: hypothetical protein G9473_05340 [Erythrobacter sp.]